MALAFAAALVAAGCGGDDEAEIPQSGARETTTTTAAEAAAEPLQVLVTNDDGIRAEGIDVLVAALTAVEGVEVTVVAPADQQSVTGGQATEGPLTTVPAQTAGGHEATAVEGFPADTIRVAFDDMGLQPDLVIAGINEGQNLGGIVEVSGTVGAARAAASRGVPALAVSQGTAATLDYPSAAELVVTWLAENRAAIAAGEFSTDSVVNVNVPSCDTGDLRGSLEVETDVATTEGAVGVPSDCTSTGEGYTEDIDAFLNGYATFAEVTVEPMA